MFVFRGEQFSLTEQKALKEGCQIYGYLEVNYLKILLGNVTAMKLSPPPPAKNYLPSSLT